ncbi:hypothetical protein evm_014827 [Chilo suppressalis]|nr:hypothetical protein evm_014827 [Chilo suppressalis]
MQSLGASQAPVVPSRLLADPIELERRLAEAGHDGFGALCEDTTPSSPPPTFIEERLHHRPVASIVAVVPRGALAPAPRPPPLIIAPQETTPPPVSIRRVEKEVGLLGITSYKNQLNIIISLLMSALLGQRPSLWME